MNAHPLADLLPSMTVEEFDQLKASIKANGQLVPIVTWNGVVLDGRHRLRACQELGIEPRLEPWVDDGTEEKAAELVAGMNLRRRNMNKAQLGMVAVKIKAFFAVRAKERQLAALETSGKRGGKVVERESQPFEEGKSRDLAARAVGVSGSHVDRSERVAKAAVQEVVAKVEKGEMSTREAEMISEHPKDRQRELVALPKTKRKQVMAKGRRVSAARKAAREAAHNYSPSFDHLKQSADAPGSANVRFLLSRLELVTVEIGKSGLTAQQYAGRFVEEFDWSDPALTTRLSYVSPAIEAIASLAVIGQRARREAA